MGKIIVVGFAACYKTTVGKLLANRLNCPFVDTDEEIEKRCKASVQQIFETHGEAYFRERESQLLRDLTDGFSSESSVVVACGGGSVLLPEFEAFAKGNVVICLTASASTVFSRLDGASRPLFDGLTVSELSACIKKRAPLYAKYANATFTTDNKTPEQVADEVYAFLAGNESSVVFQ